MNHLLLKVSIALLSLNLYSQEKIKLGTYWTEDKLSSITLLKNNQFGYTSFHGTSPFIAKEKRNQEIKKNGKAKRRFCGTVSYALNEHRSGIYSIVENKLNLNFIKPIHPVDSISFRKTKRRSKTISIKIVIKSYLYDDPFFDSIGIGTKIQSKDGSIDLNTKFESYIDFDINKKQLPMEITINDKFTFIIKKKYSQEITLFYNDFKRSMTEGIEDKTFDFDKMIKEDTK